MITSTHLKPFRSEQATPGMERPQDGRDDSGTWSGLLQTGTSGVALRTLLLVDLVDSTHLVERLGDARAYEFLARHDRLARDLLATHDGREIDKTDGFLLLFERPVDAVRFSLAYHRSLADLGQELDLEVQARAGIHLGEVFLRENLPEDVARGAKPVEVEGLAKPVAGRLCALAVGGQTLLTQGAFELSRRAMVGDDQAEDDETVWLNHGPYQFKGMAEPVDIFEVGCVGVAPLTAPKDSEKASRYRSRSQRVGRRARWLLPVLLVLVAVLIWSQRSRSPEGNTAAVRPSVAVVGIHDLSPADDMGWLSTALAEMLSTELGAGELLRVIPGERIARMQQELQLPVVSDFAEDTLRRIRGHLGTDYVLVGSYLVLAQEDGRQVQMQLRLQDTRQERTLRRFQHSGAESELFTLVAELGNNLRQALQLGDISQAEAEAVRAAQSDSAEALRLFALGLQRLRAFDPSGAQEALQQAVAEDPDFALAHKALSQAWSALRYGRNAEASALQALELAEQRQLPRQEVLSIQARYHEAAGRWGEAIDTYEVLFGFFQDNIDHGLGLAHAQAVAGRPEEALATIAQLRRLPEPARDDPRIDLEEAYAAQVLSRYEQELTAARQAVDKGRASGADSIVARAKRREAWALIQLGQPKRAARALQEARDLFAEAGDRGSEGEVLSTIATQQRFQGQLRDAEKTYESALTIARLTGNKERIGGVLNGLATLLRDRGQLAASAEKIAESLAITQETGRRVQEQDALDTLALVRFRQGRLTEARQIAEDALRVAREAGIESGAAWSLIKLGTISLAANDPAQARGHLEQAMAICEQHSLRRVRGYALVQQGLVALAEDDLELAEQRFEEARRLRKETGEEVNVAVADRALAELAMRHGKTAKAAQLARSSAQVFARQGAPDEAAQSWALLARALTLLGEHREAGSAGESARRLAHVTESPLVRLHTGILLARAAIDRGEAGAESRLRALQAEARELGHIALAEDT